MKRPYADVAIEYFSDDSKEVQYKDNRGNWVDVDMSLAFAPNIEWRIKPRELKKGRWYPVTTKYGHKVVVRCTYSSISLIDEEQILGFYVDSAFYPPEDLKHIGPEVFPDFGG